MKIGMTMRFGVLGPLEVVAPGGPVQISGSRRQALLATLLLHPNRLVPVADLVEAIWPDSVPNSAVPNIRTYVHELRGQFRAAGDPTPRLSSHSGSYRLGVGPGELDLLQFRQCATSGDRALQDGDAEVAEDRLRDAIGLWRGRALGQLDFGPVVSVKITALEEERRAAMAGWIDARLALGQHEQLIPHLRELLAEDRLDEHTWVQLIVALGGAGRTAEALTTYQEVRRVLVDEIAVEPGAELQKTHAALLNGEPLTSARRSIVRSGPAAASALGRAETHAAGPMMMASDIPAHPPGFVGREEVRRELMGMARRLNAASADGTCATVVSISGPPGVGKTATAITVAYEVAHLFPEARLFLALEGSEPSPRPPGDAIAELLSAFGFAQAAIPVQKYYAEALYRSAVAGRKMILILDDVSSAAQIRPLLPGAGHCLVLATSRVSMADLDVDRQISLGPLNTEQSVRLLANLVGGARVSAEPDEAVAIAEACEMLPLAIRIAGGKLSARPTMKLSVFAGHLARCSDVLDQLTIGDLNLRVGIKQSYQALDPLAQEAFRQLGGNGSSPITTLTLQKLLGSSEAMADRLIEQLARRHLLTAISGPGMVPGYRMPPLMCAYARELLGSAAQQRWGTIQDSCKPSWVPLRSMPA
jgi:DNA-binding SARP family transcriptional activator